MNEFLFYLKRMEQKITHFAKTRKGADTFNKFYYDSEEDTFFFEYEKDGETCYGEISSQDLHLLFKDESHNLNSPAIEKSLQMLELHVDDEEELRASIYENQYGSGGGGGKDK